MRTRLLDRTLLVVLCLCAAGTSAAPLQAKLGSELLVEAGSRQLLQLRSKAGWWFGKASSEPNLNAENELSALSPTEKAQKLKEDRGTDVAALLELKQSVQIDSQKFLESWVEGEDPCSFAKVTCDARTGRVSEIDLAVTEDLAALYPELRSVIAAFEQNQTAQQIATNKRSVQAAGTEGAQQHGPWEDSSIPSSVTAWPAGMYPYNAVTMDELPSGPAFLKLNTTLRALHVSNINLLKPTLPAAWGSFTSLRELTLAGLKLEGTLPSEWAGMINMTQLILADNHQLHGHLPDSWATMQQLKLLDLSLNYASGLRSGISGSLPHSWSNMAKLETLNLWRTSIVGHLPVSWASMKHLQVLALSDTGVSGTLPTAWSKMPKLATLHVANTLIGGALPSSWAKLRKLAFLDLRGTSVVQPVPPSWQALCSRNGTAVWDSATQAYSWPPHLQRGKVAHVYLPWSSPDGKLWEINHDAASSCNICQHLETERSMINAPVVIIASSVLLGIVGFRYRNGVSSILRLRSGRLD